MECGKMTSQRQHFNQKTCTVIKNHEIVTDNPAKVMEIFLQFIGTLFLWDYQNREEFRTLEHTMVPLCVATYYKATVSGSKLCIIVYNKPLTRGHPSCKARFSIPKRWPHKRGTTVHVCFNRLLPQNLFCCIQFTSSRSFC